MKRIARYSLIFLFLLLPLRGDAQTLDSLTINSTPERPKANQTVTLELETYSFDLQSSSITWYVNDVVKKSGVGVKTFTFTTGALGSASRVNALVTTIDGNTFSQSVTIRPADVTLVFQAETYTPPFYKGRAYLSYEGVASVVANPSFVSESGAPLNPKSLIYTWKENDKVIQSSSGYGKNVFLTQSKLPFRPITVSVEVTSPDEKYVADSTLTLTAGSPTVLFYEHNPVYGIMFNKAIGSDLTLSKDEMRIAAIPYNFTATDRNQAAFTYRWNMNNVVIESSGSDLVLRKPAHSDGLAVVSLQLANLVHLFQFTDRKVTVGFGGTDPQAIDFLR